jgi:hypothetical protein
MKILAGAGLTARMVFQRRRGSSPSQKNEMPIRGVSTKSFAQVEDEAAQIYLGGLHEILR